MLKVSMLPQISAKRQPRTLRALFAAPLCFFLLAAGASAQSAGPIPVAQPTASAAPVPITLAEAIRRAEANEPTYAAAKANSASAALDRSIARAGMLPTVRYYSQGIYTQPNGIYSESGEGVASSPNPRFVANDSRPREYMAQGIADETLGLAGPAAVRRADAAASLARAQLEIARRGLVVTVTDLFYSRLAADHKQAIAEIAYKDAASFTAMTVDRETQGEAAHADVVKAQLTEQQQWRGLQDAKLAAETARMNLAVLLFPDPLTPFSLQADNAVAPLASFADVEAAAAKNNPELKSALAALGVSNADVMSARAALLPSLGLNVIYGIDANEFALNGPMTSSGVRARNLGYSASLSVNVPVWDWLSSEHKVKQSEIRRDVARVALSATQRQLIAQLQTDYAAARTAQDELASLDLSVRTAAESLHLAELRYKSGEALVLEVVDAQNAYVAAENAREDGRVRHRLALATLQTLTGTL
ncbi:MAG TPA: TolC family protein [Terracidiphilus sp.]|nr:TolC family protein [Terracidiphilus sp.]